MAFWLLPGANKRSAAFKFYRVVLPDGVVRAGYTDEFGFAAEDNLPSGVVDLMLD